MNNILSVRLENFQSHLDSLIEFDKGLNVLVGQSDSGKTAIIRAIRWVLFNQPRGTDFIRVGANFARVTIVFENNVTIIRERTSSKNRYMIKESEKEDLILEGFGIHVPKEVVEAHGMLPLRVDRDHELNLHLSQQLDGPFLLEQTGSIRAKTIGRISGAHYLDMAIRDTSKDLSQLNQRLKHGEEEVEKLKEKLLPYEKLDEAKAKIDQTESNITSIKKNQQLLKSLKQIKRHKEQITYESTEMKQILNTVQSLSIWEEKVDSISHSLARLRDLSRKRKYLQEMHEIKKVCVHWIQITSSLGEMETIYINSKESLAKHRYFSAKRTEYTKAIQEKSQLKNQLKRTDFLKENPYQQITHMMEILGRWKQLSTLYKNEKKLNETKTIWKQTLQQLRNAEAVEHYTKQIDYDLSKWRNYQLLKEKRDELRQGLHVGTQFIKQQKSHLQILEETYEQILLSKGHCPVCGGEIQTEKVEALLSGKRGN
ncbi:AAA family ATPase [Alkalihalobacillus trypoxylicola]|uniref:Nuclease SbcCD subunit C n=1 Tax=Alkalihalobacillus trypoxylicola TaxID=519424 RepID=A0A161QAV8_9BACI|nr:AAA family ATPase [Alkalihalobacillus trypoxylicola]KYG34987.1 hypothetical protein AZF04_01240 [Alkalihalobacillus trypoxylicola]